jgi:E3 ubiquitin-protein ligase HERC1
LFLDSKGRLLACGYGAALGHGGATAIFSEPTPVAAITGVRVRSVAAGCNHSLALGWDGRVYSWGLNDRGQLGIGDRLDRLSPALVEGLEDVRSIATPVALSVAVTQSGDVLSWGQSLRRGWPTRDSLRPVIVEGFEEVRVYRVFAGEVTAFALGEAGELFSWGRGEEALLGHSDTHDQPSPKLVEALRGVRVSEASIGFWHGLALTEDGLVYSGGKNTHGVVLGNPDVKRELLLKPVEALRSVRVSTVAAGGARSYAVADTGELWAWGCDGNGFAALGHGEQTRRPLLKPVQVLRGVKVDAVAAGGCDTRTRTTEACTRGAAGLPRKRLRSAWALPWGGPCPRRSASPGCVRHMGCDDTL